MTDTALIEAARSSKSWPFQEAQRLAKRYPGGKRDGSGDLVPVLFETGYGPSGLPHIGTFQEVLRTTLVRRAYEMLTGGAPTRLVAFSDDMDGLRKVPDNIPNTELLRCQSRQAAQPHSRSVRRRLRELLAHHNNAMLRDFLDRFGFDYEFLAATDRYNSGPVRRCAEERAAQLRRDHGRDAADLARGAPQDLFAGAADQRGERHRAAGAGRSARCRDRPGPLRGSRAEIDRTVDPRRQGQAAMEGRLGDALGRARRRLRDERQGPDRQRHPVAARSPGCSAAGSPKG